MFLYDRDDLIAALSEVAHRMQQRGIIGSINIVGGASISLQYFNRRATLDVDALIAPLREILEISEEIAVERGWDLGWLNNKAQGFIPSAKGNWISIFDGGGVSICVAEPQTLLAMKIRASRPLRDLDDIADLLGLCQVGSVVEAEELFEEYFRGEVMPEKAYALLEGIFKKGIPAIPQAPPKPVFRV